jgi:hypothetical protein
VVKRCVRVYIEGGSEGRDADSRFRYGWKKFLNGLHELARENGYHSLEVIRGKGRGDTFRRFTKHETKYPDDLCVLLVDAETAVPAGTCVWDVVARRKGDNWKRPSFATERHLYLMVHFVETWLLSDQDALRTFFKRGFDPRPLPKTNLEDTSKADIERALERATRGSSKGPYRHGQAHEIIGFVQPERVQQLRHGHRLFSSLGSLIKGAPEIP